MRFSVCLSLCLWLSTIVALLCARHTAAFVLTPQDVVLQIFYAKPHYSTTKGRGTSGGFPDARFSIYLSISQHVVQIFYATPKNEVDHPQTIKRVTRFADVPLKGKRPALEHAG